MSDENNPTPATSDQPEIALPTETLEDILAAAGQEFPDQREVELPLSGARIGYGFKMTPLGLRHQAKNDEHATLLVQAPFDVQGRITDPDGRRPGTLICWRDRLGRDLETVVDDALVHSQGTTILAELSDRGLPVCVSAEKHLKLFFNSLQKAVHLTRFTQPGWQEDGTFVLITGDMFGPSAGLAVLANAMPHRHQQAGDLEGWQRDVAALAGGNSRLVFALSLGFAGPVMLPCEESFLAVHYEGASSTGKTTAQIVACSAHGRPDLVDMLRSWRATDNGLEGVAYETNDTLSALDEIGQAHPDTVKNSLYMLANGAGKSRATKDGGARSVKKWRCCLISTGERSPEDIILAAKRDNPAGLDVRLASIPADAGAGMGLFEHLHGSATPADFAVRITSAAMAQHGHAGRLFIARLVSERSPEFDAGLRKEVDRLTQVILPPRAGGQVSRVARKFAVVALAGELAISWSILPFAPGTSEDAARICFAAWLTRRGTAGSREEADIIRAARHFIGAHGASRFGPSHPRPEDDRFVQQIRDRAGWMNGDDYWMTTDAFAGMVAPAKVTDAIRVLHAAGFAGAPRSVVKRIGFNQQQVRVYVIRGSILAHGGPSNGGTPGAPKTNAVQADDLVDVADDLD